MVAESLNTQPEAAGPTLEVSPTLELRPPQPIYDPQNHTVGSGVNPQVQYQSMEVLVESAATHTTLEAEVSPRDGDHYVEEDTNIAVGETRQGRVDGPVVDKDIRGNSTETPQDAIRPSLDA